MLLVNYEDDLLEAVKRVERAIQSGEGEDAFFVVFLGSGVWDFQLLYTATPPCYSHIMECLRSN